MARKKQIPSIDEALELMMDRIRSELSIEIRKIRGQVSALSRKQAGMERRLARLQSDLEDLPARMDSSDLVRTRRRVSPNRAQQAILGAGVQVFDRTSGQMRSLIDIMSDFADATRDMTEQERNRRVVQAFGARGLLAFNAIMNASFTTMRDGRQVTLRGAEAIEALRTALKHAPNQASIHVQLGSALARAGDRAAAAKHCAAAEKLEPGSTSHRIGLKGVFSSQKERVWAGEPQSH